MSASASIPASAWSATWAPTSASTIRCSATASIWPRASKGQSKEYGFPDHHRLQYRRWAVKDRFAILELDFIMVKGKKEPEVIYAIAGREDTAQSGRFQRLRNLTIEMLACYRNRDWEGALAAHCARPQDRRGEFAGAALQSLRSPHPRLSRKSAAAGLERRLRAADEVTPFDGNDMRGGNLTARRRSSYFP
jgi:hypothetical protein